MSLKQRIAKLETALATERCSCPTSIDLGWLGHQPPDQCTDCGGERLIYLIRDQPLGAEPLMRSVLSLLAETYDGTTRPDYSRLTDSELDQIRTALQAVEATHPQI
jgi:hypothetical protein